MSIHKALARVQENFTTTEAAQTFASTVSIHYEGLRQSGLIRNDNTASGPQNTANTSK